MWRWELRDCRLLPKALRSEAVRRKKELHKARMPVLAIRSMQETSFPSRSSAIRQFQTSVWTSG